MGLSRLRGRIRLPARAARRVLTASAAAVVVLGLAASGTRR